MKRNPGEWLRDRLIDRVVQAGLLGMVGWGWLSGAGLVLWVTRGPGHAVPEWMVWSLLLPGAVFVGTALFKAKRGWRLADMRKGAGAEERVGQAVEYALTGEGCAVAHHVEGEVAKIGDIDHLVATPRGLWVIETKNGRVPERVFPETLRRIALNVAGVRNWAPGVSVTGCLVFGTEPKQRPKSTFEWGSEKIRCFANPESLMRELRDDVRSEGGSSNVARRVWRLAKVETA